MKPIKVSIGWSTGAPIVSRLIRRLDNSAFNHVYWRFDFDSGSLVYESHLSGGVQITPYEHILAAKTKGIITRTFELELDLAPKQCVLLWNDCLPLHGKGYDITRIVGYYLWIRLRGRRGKPHLHLPNHYTCNEFIVASGRYVVDNLVGVDFSYTPEGLYMLFLGHPSRSIGQGALASCSTT